jgi:hypothetical protein
MSVWLEKSRRRPDGQLCDRLSKISLKFFPDLNLVRTMLPCHPDGCTFAAHNFHINALCVWTIGMIFRPVDLMHAISIYVARSSGPWRLASRRLNFEYATCLMDERIQMGIHIVRKVAVVFPYLCFGKKSIAGRTLSDVRTCCWNIQTDAGWSSSKLLNTEEGPDGKFSSSERMMLWTVGCPDDI